MASGSLTEYVGNEKSVPENGDGNNIQEGKSEVENLEEATNKYYDELILELIDLRQEVGEERTLNRILTSTQSTLLGRIESHLQRIDDLGVEELEQMMEKAKEEIEDAKLESLALDEDLLAQGIETLYIVRTETNAFEDLRFEFKNPVTIDRYSSLEDQVTSRLENRGRKFEERAKKAKDASEDLQLTLESMEKADLIIDQLTTDTEMTSQEIHVLGFQLVDLEKELDN